MKEHVYDMLVIGGGPAGYTAALYAVRAGLDAVVLERGPIGGQMALTARIDNYPGFEEGIDGYALGARMRLGAERFGARTVLAEVQAAELTGAVKTVRTREGTLLGRTVVLASGADHRELGLPGERELTGRGVHYCAACDGMFYKGKTVVVVGGGNSAAEDALLLSRVCGKVLLVHRRDRLRASRIYAEQLQKAANVVLCWNRAVTEILGENGLTGVKLRDTVTGAETTVACDGLFISVGRRPAADLVRGQLDLDENGYVTADESTRTGIPGVFAAGDVRTKALRQIVTAAADGAAAAHWAEAYLTAEDAR